MFLLFFFNHPATTEIYTLSLHDALPICSRLGPSSPPRSRRPSASAPRRSALGDRKSTRLNSSHRCISYAVFCLKKKKTNSQEADHNQNEQQLREDHAKHDTARHGQLTPT